MEQALGWLRWTPEAFWGATLAEVTAGLVGFAEAKTGRRSSAHNPGMDSLLDMARQARRDEIRAEQRG